MTKTLKQTVRDKFEMIELNTEQLAVIEQQVASAHSSTTPQRSHPRQLRWRSAAAVAAILILCGVLLQGVYDATSARSLHRSIAAEVVENHLKLKPIEVQSGNLHEVLGYFDRLDFQPLYSPRIASETGDRLLGGRYCSIQGISAAQLRVESKNGKLSTFFQVALPPEQSQFIPDVQKGEQAVVVDVKGVSVRIWRERGIVLVEVE